MKMNSEQLEKLPTSELLALKDKLELELTHARFAYHKVTEEYVNRLLNERTDRSIRNSHS